MTTFTEDWFFEADCQALQDLAHSVEDLDGEIVEVGCWEGKSTIALARAVAPATVHAVDTWQGSPGEESAVLAAERDVLATFLDNIAERTTGNVEPHQMGWRDFFANWDLPIRLIHVDATHSYDEVRDNIETVRPLIVPGGVICGDDIHHLPVRQAVADALGNAFLAGAKLWYWRL